MTFLQLIRCSCKPASHVITFGKIQDGQWQLYWKSTKISGYAIKHY